MFAVDAGGVERGVEPSVGGDGASSICVHGGVVVGDVAADEDALTERAELRRDRLARVRVQIGEHRGEAAPDERLGGSPADAPTRRR